MVTTQVSIPGYQVSKELYNGSRTLVYRAVRETDSSPVVIKLLKNPYPSFSQLVQFRNQYTIAKKLNYPGIIQTYSLEPYKNGYMLVMEDFGGISSKKYFSSLGTQHISFLEEFLQIAISLCDTLDILYRHHVIHKDIKPANILINPETKINKIIDFSIASLLSKENQEIKSLNILEGTLAYISPEQTGRMNRGVDYRSDFYSLGVTLYELLTGELPFISDDPMELVHCHIAKIPPRLGKNKHENIPPIIGNILTKLMAKNAEDRYQSAIGLKYDLQQCLMQWQKAREISVFELGQRDLNDRFLIPEKLYGRENEVKTLLNAFDRVAQGDSELMLIAGFSGIGKTAIVNEVHKPITRQNGYFIKGKFDQFNRNIPLSAFVQSFRDLMGQLLSESDAQLQTWKTKILDTLGENGQVMIEVIPELERVIGSQPPATELSGTAAQNRFNLLFQKFIQVFATSEHPLVMFLDDLQWADLASLNLIQILMAESTTGYLLLIGAYRDNEVFAAHPLMLTLDTLNKAGVTVNTIVLSPLSQPSLNQLIADTLHCVERLVEPLTELVMQKTQGNPFFATQFLKVLHQENLITFDSNAGYWQCDIVRVCDAALTDDVVEFMALQLQKLPTATQTILKLAACIGAQFDLQTLAIVSQQSQTEAATALWKALQDGLISPQSEVYRFYLGDVEVERSELSPTFNYKFLHDRIQQAAYSLISDEYKPSTHLKIGQLILANTPKSEQEKKIFEIVNHLNKGHMLINHELGQQELVHLNQLAGQKAKSATAYRSALDYFNRGIDLLKCDRWQSQYSLALTVYTGATESAYLNTQFEQMEQLAEEVLNHAESWLDRSHIYVIKIQACIAQNRPLIALQLAREVLENLGIALPEKATISEIAQIFQSTQSLIDSQGLESLLVLPIMTEPSPKAAMVILSKILSVAYQVAPDLLPLIIFTQINLSIQYGNAPESTYAYVMYGGMLASRQGDIETGYRFGQLGMNLLNHLNASKLAAKTIFGFNAHLRYLKEPLQETLTGYLQAYTSGLETGDLEYVALSLLGYSYTAYYSGKELSSLKRMMDDHRKVMQHLRQDGYFHTQSSHYQAVLNLLVGQAEPDCLSGEFYDEAERIQSCLAINKLIELYQIYLNKLILAYLFQRYEQALENAHLAKQYETAAKGLLFMPICSFYEALTQLAVYSDASETEQAQILKQVTTHQDYLSEYAIHAPTNYAHRCLLISAERDRVLGERAVAIDLYDRAIQLAHENGFIQDEALANELAARFYLNWGKEKVAAGYMQEAYYCYVKWGAKAKTDDLEKRYPQLLKPILESAAQSLNVFETFASIVASNVSLHSSIAPSRSSSTSVNTALDFSAVIKASQSLAGTIQLNELLHQLTQIILQNSGADRCELILPNSTDKWSVVAIATPTTTELCDELLEGNLQSPVKLIQYVKNTQETVIIDDCKTELPVIGQYLNQHQPKSVLCLPILNQGQLTGILYLENRATSKVFTTDRLLVLNFLCTQAAISLENAKLYTQRHESNTQLQNLANNLPGIIYKFRVDLQGQISFPFMSNRSREIFELESELICENAHALVSQIDELDLPSFQIAVQTSMELLQPFSWTGRFNLPSGQQKWIEVSSVPTKEVDGSVIWDGVTLDVNARKIAEAAAMQKSQELEQALNDLQQSQLQTVQSEKMASLGNLVAGVAHEINNPIGFLNGSIKNATDYTQDLLKHIALYQQHHPNPAVQVQDHAEKIDLEYLSEDFPKLLNSMKGATDRIKGISTSLRIFSRADNEHKVKTNLHEGIDSTILILKYRLKANQHRPEIQIIQQYGDLPLVQCFPGQLNQVFMNILANAIDMFDEAAQQSTFTDLEANPQIITIQTVLREKSTVEIRIGDNGKGMSEEVRAKIFDHLFTTKAVGKGTGLGLAIARQIVLEKHGGGLEVSSGLNQGTEFTIQLPTNETQLK